MKRIVLFLATVFTLGFLPGCDLINKQMQKPEQQQTQPAQTQDTNKTADSATQKTDQDKLIKGPLGTVGQETQKK